MSVKLRVVQGRPCGKTLAFPDGTYYIGRGAECHVRPNSEWVSRQHCLLRVAGLVATIRDLGSRNGTLVNGQLLDRERKLDEGDRIQVGPLVFEVHLEERSTGQPPPAVPTEPIAADEAAADEGKDRAGPYGTTAEIPILPPPPES
jgi:pSer/pThr/pTyr-binding forkhead associated (FHA) protein